MCGAYLGSIQLTSGQCFLVSSVQTVGGRKDGHVSQGHWSPQALCPCEDFSSTCTELWLTVGASPSQFLLFLLEAGALGKSSPVSEAQGPALGLPCWPVKFSPRPWSCLMSALMKHCLHLTSNREFNLPLTSGFVILESLCAATVWGPISTGPWFRWASRSVARTATVWHRCSWQSVGDVNGQWNSQPFSTQCYLVTIHRDFHGTVTCSFLY